MDIRTRIQQAINSALTTQGVSSPDAVLEYPAVSEHGDFACNAALAYAKELKTNPRTLAEALVKHIGTIDGVANIAIAGPGFINFTLTAQTVDTLVNYSITQGNAWGSNNARKGEKVMVEYTDPNPFKEFHIGHLMSNAIGESIARLLESQGADVVRANWQGDVGPHVAKAIWGKMQKPELSWGQAYAYGATNYDTHKEEVDTINKQVYEKSNPEVQKLYNEGRESSLAHFEELYKILGTTFDHYFFEGTEGLEGKPIVEEFLQQGVFEKSDGAVVFAGEQYGLHTRVFLTSKGLPTYEAKELGLNKAKFEKEPNLAQSIIITANEQSEYFKVVLKAMELIMPTVAAKTKHIAHGMMKLPSGKMSSRTGDVITGESLLAAITDKAVERAQQSRADDVRALGQQLAVGAIKYQVLKQATGKDIIFEQDRALSIEGDSGPYLQYTHARCASIIEKSPHQSVQGRPDEQEDSLPQDVERLLTRFPDIVARAAREYAPHYVAQYLLELASAFNRFYANEHILDGSAQQAHKVAITKAVQITLKNGLHLLGITAPNKM